METRHAAPPLRRHARYRRRYRTDNPGQRIRRAADKLSHYEISAHLANAITGAADAAHARAWEESNFGEASADAIVDAEHHDELAAAWSLVAAEHQLIGPDIYLALGGSMH
jgi:hypothetical protein